MDLVCRYRLAFVANGWQQCSQMDAPMAVNVSTLFVESLPELLSQVPEICPTEQLANLSITLPVAFLDSPQVSTPTSSLAVRLGIKLLTTLLQLALSIPLRIFHHLLVTILSAISQLAIDLFIHHQLQPFLILTVAILLIVLLRRRLNFWQCRNIPFECITAHLSQLRTLTILIPPVDDITRVRRLGKVFGSFKLTSPVLCIADHRLIEQVLFTKSDHFTGQNTWQLEGHLLPESIFTTNCSADIGRWKRKKAILLSSFLSRKIKLLGPTLDGLTQELLGFLRRQIPRRSTSIWRTTLDDLVFPWLVYSLSALILDIDLPKYHLFVQKNNQQASQLVDSCRHFVQANRQIRQSALFHLAPDLGRFLNGHLLNATNCRKLQRVLNDAICYRLENDLLGLPEVGGSKRNSKKCVKFRDQVYNSLIAAGKTDGENTTSQRPTSPRPQLQTLTFIDIILNYEIEPEDKVEGYDLSRQEVLDNLVAFFTVSLTTLSDAISGALFYLALKQCEQQKVRQEVLDCIGTDRQNINWETLRNLKYTEAFIKEVLRLTSPIGRIERMVTKRVTLDWDDGDGGGQLTLLPELPVSILVSAVHRNAEYYPEPELFKPSRFYQHDAVPESPGIVEKPPATDGAKYLAFGLGARTCIGLKFVMFYLKHLIANIVLEYDLKLVTSHLKLPGYTSRPLDIGQMTKAQVELSPLKKSSSFGGRDFFK